jgi:UDP-N-acetyl-D-mannosaminuronate dehydrogenase
MAPRDGQDVRGADVDAAKVDEICAARNRVAEPDLEARVAPTVVAPSDSN